MKSPLTADLTEAFNIATLRKAWKWLNTNSDVNYKNYFRSLFLAYSLSIDENLTKLSTELKRSKYKPDHLIFFLHPFF